MWGFLYSSGNTLSDRSEMHYPEQLTGIFTGGFGEETCHSCHFDYPLNYQQGALQIDGLPDAYEPGKTYRIRIELTRPALNKAGFQLSARHPDGSQAGSFMIASPRVERTGSAPDSIQFVQHSVAGTEPTGGDRTTWELQWNAPSGNGDDVIFHLAANAANGDASEFGDFILTRELILSAHR